MTSRVVKTVCPRDCYDTCGLLVTVEDGKIITVRGDPDHPVTRGFTCPRGAADIRRTYSGERVLYPHVRTPDGGFTRTTWDEALDAVTSNLKAVLEEHAPDSVLQTRQTGPDSRRWRGPNPSAERDQILDSVARDRRLT